MKLKMRWFAVSVLVLALTIMGPAAADAWAIDNSTIVLHAQRADFDCQGDVLPSGVYLSELSIDAKRVGARKLLLLR